MRYLLWFLFILTMPFANIHASGLSCYQAHYAQTEETERISFKKPTSEDGWLQVVQRIRNTSLFANETFDQNILHEAQFLSPELKSRLIEELAKDFISLKKEPNRRLAEKLYTALAQNGSEFMRLILNEEHTPDEAYARVFAESAKLMGGVPTMSVYDIRNVVRIIRGYLKENPNVSFILYGSAVNGRAQIEKTSDVDIEVFSPKQKYHDVVQNNLPWFLRRKILFSKGQDIAQFLKKKFSFYPRLKLMESRVSVFHQYWEEAKTDWRGFKYVDSIGVGEVNTFAIEVNSEGNFLHVFEPKSSSEKRDWRVANPRRTFDIFTDIN